MKDFTNIWDWNIMTSKKKNSNEEEALRRCLPAKNAVKNSNHDTCWRITCGTINRKQKISLNQSQIWTGLFNAIYAPGIINQKFYWLIICGYSTKMQPNRMKIYSKRKLILICKIREIWKYLVRNAIKCSVFSQRWCSTIMKCINNLFNLKHHWKYFRCQKVKKDPKDLNVIIAQERIHHIKQCDGIQS